MTRSKPCTHKTASDHLTTVHHYTSPITWCNICKSTRKVRTFKHGRASEKPCLCMVQRERQGHQLGESGTTTHAAHGVADVGEGTVQAERRQLSGRNRVVGGRPYGPTRDH